eukprot:8973533-Pyramimonas_sp.AAC.2
MDACTPASLVWAGCEGSVHLRQGSRVHRPRVAQARDPAISVPVQRHDVCARDAPSRVHREDEDILTVQPRRNASGQLLGRRRHFADRFRAEERALHQLMQNFGGSPSSHPRDVVSQPPSGLPGIARRAAGLRRTRRISGGTSAPQSPNGNAVDERSGCGRPGCPRCGRALWLRRGDRGSPRACV